MASSKFKFQYVPRPGKQTEFHNLCAGNNRVILALGGVRAGKTLAAVAEIFYQIYKHGLKVPLVWVVSPTLVQSEAAETHFKRLAQTAEGCMFLKHLRGKRTYIMRPSPKNPKEFVEVVFKTGSEPDNLKGFAVGYIVLDEAAIMKREVLDIALARTMECGGKIVLATTPKGKNWVWKDVYLPSLEGEDRYACIKIPTPDNFYLEPKEHEFLARRYASRSSTLGRQELEAEFVDFEGKVFDHFDPGTHIVRADLDIPDSVPVIVGMDWGVNDPTVAVFLSKWDGVWVIRDEYYEPGRTMKDHATVLRQHPLWPLVRRIWCDPSGLQERKEFLALGIKTLPARRPEKDKHTSWPVMRARQINAFFARRMSDPRKDKVGQSIPGLVMSENCVNGAREIMGMAYDRTAAYTKDPKYGKEPVVVNKRGEEIEKNASERLTQFDDHFIDALGYALFSEDRTLGSNFSAIDNSQRVVVPAETIESKPPTPQSELVKNLAEISKMADRDKASRLRSLGSAYDQMAGL